MTVNNGRLGGTDNSNGDIIDADDTNDTTNAAQGQLGQIAMFALSMTGAVTKTSLQTLGWAICDGTTPASQGISLPTIETTPDLQDKFLSMSNDESSGTTGGVATNNLAHTHTISDLESGDTGLSQWQSNPTTSSALSSATENRPPFYELAFFIKAK